MASEPRALTVIRSRTAIEDLDGIWRWNAEHYSPSHADAYLRFLQDRIDALADHFDAGKPVPTRPDLRWQGKLSKEQP
jgi:plasmid stabilization system protein ParE